MRPEPEVPRGRAFLAGLTGGIACGKSEAAGVLAGIGVSVLDTDRVAHEVMRPDRPAYAPVVDAFGEAILGPDGAIDRKRLGDIVFADAQARERLNALVHPFVRSRWIDWRDALKAEGRSGVAVIPLLYEVGAVEGWDAVLCVAAPERLVMERLRRRGLTEAAARARLAAQWPVEEKMRRADIVIWNDGTLDELSDRTKAAWRRVTEGEYEHG